MAEKNTEQERIKKKIRYLDDQKKKYTADIERKKLVLKKKELRLKERELNKMEHLVTFQEFIP
ncbi:MAG: hypothetical protein JXB49_25400 [Bacteroidales bacterium]|nr:hypothetical protein [Bacteroidales bacterium]